MRNAEQDLSFQRISQMLEDRRQSMRVHNQNKPVPVTFIAHNQDRVIGCVSLIRYTGSREPNRIWLTNLYVDFPFQRRGVGSSLLEHAVSFARSHNLQELSLYTFDAKNYYSDRGWSWLSSGEVHHRPVDFFTKSL